MSTEESSFLWGTLRPFEPTGHPHRIDAYRIERLLGSGGMGVVYLGVHEELGREVAIKLLRRGDFSEQSLRRMERESRILARLDHPGLVRVFTTGVHYDGSARRPFFVMDVVRGVSWREALIGLGFEERLLLLKQLCDIVAAAHAHGCIHRDLKPSNVMVERSEDDTLGHVRLLDFGLARILGSEETLSPLTLEGQVLGSRHYMSPEQRSGDSGSVDTRADVYALGRIASEAVRAYRSAELDRANAGKLGAERFADFRAVVARASATDPDRRTSSAAELGEEFGRLLRDEPVHARRLAGRRRARWFLRRNRWSIVVAMATLCSALMTANAWRTALQEERETSEIYQTYGLAASKLLAEPNLFEGWVSHQQLLDASRGTLEKAPTALFLWLEGEFFESLGNRTIDAHWREAQQSYRRSYAPRRLLAERFPDQAVFRSNLSIATVKLGDVENQRATEELSLASIDRTRVRAALGRALAEYQTALDLDRTQFRESDPQSGNRMHGTAANDLLWSFQRTATTLFRLGELDRAAALATEGRNLYFDRYSSSTEERFQTVGFELQQLCSKIGAWQALQRDVVPGTPFSATELSRTLLSRSPATREWWERTFESLRTVGPTASTNWTATCSELFREVLDDRRNRSLDVLYPWLLETILIDGCQNSPHQHWFLPWALLEREDSSWIELAERIQAALLNGERTPTDLSEPAEILNRCVWQRHRSDPVELERLQASLENLATAMPDHRLLRLAWVHLFLARHDEAQAGLALARYDALLLQPSLHPQPEQYVEYQLRENLSWLAAVPIPHPLLLDPVFAW